MALDSAQLVVYGNDIRANSDGTVIAALAAGNVNDIAAFYNGNPSVDFNLFTASMPINVVLQGIDWTEYEALSAASRDGLNLLLNRGSESALYLPNPENQRVALNTLFSGSPNTKASILALAVRLATEFEKLFAVTATGPGGGDGSSSANSANLVAEGPTTPDETLAALNVTA